MADGSVFPDRPNLDVAKNFWPAYTGDAQKPIRIALLHSIAWPEELKKRGHFSPFAPYEREGTLDELWPLIVEKQREGYACYFFANETPAGFLGNIRNQDVTRIRSLHIDCDNGLPDTWHLDPSIIVKTSQKLGDDGRLIQKGAAFWLIDDMPKDEFSRAQAQLIAHYGSDKQVKDAKRVMRLPGSVHRKPAISGADLRAQLIANPAREALDGIPLSAPQLVTFTDPHGGIPNFAIPLGPMPSATVLSGLGSSSSSTTAPQSSSSSSRSEFFNSLGSKTYAELYAVLRYNNPYTDREGWGKTVKALPEIPIAGNPPDAMQRKLDLAKDFEAGRLFHRLPTPEERKHLNGAFRGPDEVEKLFAWAEGKECGGFGALVNRAKEENPDWHKASAPPPTGLPGAEPTRLPNIALYDDLEMDDWPDTQELVVGLVARGEHVAFVAAPKMSKSFLALEIALSIAAVVPVLGHFPVKYTGPVVYLSAEGHGGFKKRIRAWLQHRGIDREQIRGRFFYNKGVPFARNDMSEALAFVSAIKERVGDGVVFLVIDTMARSLSGLNENDSGDVTKFNDMLEVLRKHMGDGCATLTLAHATNKEDVVRRRTTVDFRGSSAASANFDAVHTLDYCKDTKIIELSPRWLKDVDEDDRPAIYFRFDKIPEFKSGALTRVDPPAKRADSAEKHQALKTILAQLQLDKLTGRVMTAAELAAHIAKDPPACFGVGDGPVEEGSSEHAVRREKIGQMLRDDVKEGRKHVFGVLIRYEGVHPSKRRLAAERAKYSPREPQIKPEWLWCLNAEKEEPPLGKE